MIPALLHYPATLAPSLIQSRLGQLLVPGPISDPGLECRIGRMEEAFHRYAALAPFGMWARGLAITPEMRSYTEAHLPLSEIADLFRRLFALSLQVPPHFAASPTQTSACWLDFLHAVQSQVVEPNPARLLRRLMQYESFRVPFLFALFLPPRYGNGFSRYRGQEEVLRSWLGRNNKNDGRQGIRCLDAACGSGEGSYDLALLLRQDGFEPERSVVRGVTIDPLELFAAAHGWFPHDLRRQDRFRLVREDLTEARCSRITFSLGDIRYGGFGGDFDIILCNGFLGGPLLHDRNELAEAVAHLCTQLKSGGILLAADRFHGGWKRLVPEQEIQEMLVRNGLTLVDITEGIAGVK